MPPSDGDAAKRLQLHLHDQAALRVVTLNGRTHPVSRKRTGSVALGEGAYAGGRLTSVAWLAGVWVSPLRLAGFALLALGMLFFFYFLGSFLLLPGTRVLTLSAESRSITVAYRGANQVLAVGEGARLCREGSCEVGHIEDVLVLGDKEQLVFRYLPQSGIVRVTILSDLRGEELRAGSVIEIPTDGFATTGTQAFIGTIQVGEQVQSFRSHHLVGGNYSFYQLDPIAWLIGREADELRTGTFLQGDVAVPVCSPRRWYKLGNDAWKGCIDDPGSIGLAQQTMFGHIALSTDGDGTIGTSLTVTGTSDAGASALAIFRFGRSRPLLIETGLVELVQASPVFLAISAFMAVLGGLLQTAGWLGQMRPVAIVEPRTEVGVPSSESLPSSPPTVHDDRKAFGVAVENSADDWGRRGIIE